MSIAGKKDRRVIVILSAVIVSGAISGVFLSGFGDLVSQGMADTDFSNLLSQDVENPALYDINSTSEWSSSSGILWTYQASALDDGKFQILNYGRWENYGYRSAANYRTSEINASNESFELDTLEATGYVGESVNSALRMKIYDCTKSQIEDDPDRLVETCYGDNVVYDSGLIETSGRVELNEDLSNITIDGYMNIGMDVVANTTEAPEDPSYWSSLRLTRQKSKTNWGIENWF